MKNIKIGRSPANDIVVSDPTVSSNHAVITIGDNDRITIKDLNSTNGTYVNGQRISLPVSLRPGDVIKAGSATVDWMRHLENDKRGHSLPSPGAGVGTVKRKLSIGRGAGNDIVLARKEVSASHAQLIEKQDGEVVIADSGSTNGTWVNGRKISMHVLRPGDRVMIANKYPLNWKTAFGSGGGASGKPSLKTRGLKKYLLPAMAAVAAVVLCVVLAGRRPWSPEKIYATYAKSVVMVEFAYYYEVYVDGKMFGYYAGLSRDRKGNLVAVISRNSDPKLFGGTGTGFFVSQDGRIVTNRHIVAPWEYVGDDEEIEFVKEYVESMLLEASLSENISLLSKVGKVTVEGRMYNEYLGVYLNGTHTSQGSKIPCSVIAESGSDDIDIGVLQVNSKTLPAGAGKIIDLKRAVVSDGGIVVGEPVYTIGFPTGETLATTSQGLEANNQDGKITQLRGEYEFGHNIPIVGGASGSPVFNRRGRLIGVVHKGYSASQGYNMAVKARYAVELASKNQ